VSRFLARRERGGCTPARREGSRLGAGFGSDGPPTRRAHDGAARHARAHAHGSRHGRGERDPAALRGRRDRRSVHRAAGHAPSVTRARRRARAQSTESEPRAGGGGLVLKTLLLRTVRTAALSVALVLFASGVRAESLPPPALPSKITLADALELLRNRSPRTRAEQARLEVASAARLEASVYPNPSLSYGALLLARGANTGARRQHEIVVEQPLLLFGQRGARGRVAELSIRAERARIAASLAERELAVRQAFAALLARQERVSILDDAVLELARLEQIVLTRHREGDRSRYDV